jgi:hypothetical protein
MAAMAGANGAKSWLDAHHPTWVTPRRMRAATIGIFSAGILASSVTISGSSAAPVHHPAPAAAHAAAR